MCTTVCIFGRAKSRSLNQATVVPLSATASAASAVRPVSLSGSHEKTYAARRRRRRRRHSAATGEVRWQQLLGVGGSCAHLAPRAWRRLAVVLEATAETRTRRFTSYVATIKHSRTAAAASALHCTVQSSQLLSSYCCTAAWLRPDSYSGVLCRGVILVMEFHFMVQIHSKSPRFKYRISSYKALPGIIPVIAF